MGWVGVIKEFTRIVRGTANTSDVKVDRGGGDIRTPQHFGAPGDDAVPLPGDYVAAVAQTGSGRDSVVGYIDPKNEQKSEPGDRRIYARNSDGDSVVECWLKNDGTAILSNDAGSIELLANGNINLNSVIIKPDGAVIIPDSLTLAGKEIAGHGHPQGADSDGNTQQDTGGNL